MAGAVDDSTINIVVVIIIIIIIIIYYVSYFSLTTMCDSVYDFANRTQRNNGSISQSVLSAFVNIHTLAAFRVTSLPHFRRRF